MALCLFFCNFIKQLVAVVKESLKRPCIGSSLRKCGKSVKLTRYQLIRLVKLRLIRKSRGKRA